MNTTTLPDRIEIETAANPTHAIVWLHGLGADGNDFAALVPELRLPPTPAIRFIFPHAPVRPISINNGMAMRAWYDVLAVDLERRADEQGIRESEALVRQAVERENARGIPSQNIVLAGFSQGCAMALHTGLRLEHALAGIVGLSGYLPLSNTVAAERQPANQHTPIFLAHGTLDPVVALTRAQATHQQLEDLRYDVRWKTYSMPHAVCPDEVADIAAFLTSVLK